MYCGQSPRKPKRLRHNGIVVPPKAALRDLFRFLLVFRFSHTVYLLSFFRFFFWKNDLRNAKHSRTQKNKNTVSNRSRENHYREQEKAKANVTKCKTFKNHDYEHHRTTDKGCRS